MTRPYPKTRLFVEQDSCPALAQSVRIQCSEEHAHLLLRVLRLGVGEYVSVFNGCDGEWLARITETQKKSLTLELTERRHPYMAAPDVWVAFAPIKFGRIDYLVQKITELGAARIQPVITAYTQSERVNSKRLRANAVEAAEQCERVEVPVFEEPQPFDRWLAAWPADRLLLFADEVGECDAISTLSAHPKPAKWGMIIGPEGGFSADERALIRSRPFARAVHLGPRILRADTAAITLLCITQSYWGDWQQPPHFESSFCVQTEPAA